MTGKNKGIKLRDVLNLLNDKTSKVLLIFGANENYRKDLLPVKETEKYGDYEVLLIHEISYGIAEISLRQKGE